MDQNKIADLIREGKIDAALKLLKELRPQVDSAHKIEIDLITARFNALDKDSRLNQISHKEETRDLSKITYALLQLVDKIYSQETSFSSTKDSAKEQIELLSSFFKYILEERASLRLREKNHLVKLIHHFFVEHPSLVYDFLNTKEQAIIAAIALKLKLEPKIDQLHLLAQICPNALSRYSKGYIVNALGEFVYSAEIRFGDDAVIFKTLDMLKKDADITLLKNIERVEIALQYFLGHIK